MQQYYIITLCFPDDDAEDMFLDVDDGVLNGKQLLLIAWSLEICVDKL